MMKKKPTKKTKQTNKQTNKKQTKKQTNNNDNNNNNKTTTTAQLYVSTLQQNKQIIPKESTCGFLGGPADAMFIQGVWDK